MIHRKRRKDKKNSCHRDYEEELQEMHKMEYFVLQKHQSDMRKKLLYVQACFNLTYVVNEIL